jgi:hypothetical protein
MLEIEIDCPPGYTRPDVYFKNIVETLKSNENKAIREFSETLKNLEPVSKRFGNWVWEIDAKNLHTELQNIFKEKLTEIYNKGGVRYASW